MHDTYKVLPVCENSRNVLGMFLACTAVPQQVRSSVHSSVSMIVLRFTYVGVSYLPIGTYGLLPLWQQSCMPVNNSDAQRQSYSIYVLDTAVGISVHMPCTHVLLYAIIWRNVINNKINDNIVSYGEIIQPTMILINIGCRDAKTNHQQEQPTCTAHDMSHPCTPLLQDAANTVNNKHHHHSSGSNQRREQPPPTMLTITTRTNHDSDNNQQQQQP